MRSNASGDLLPGRQLLKHFICQSMTHLRFYREAGHALTTKALNVQEKEFWFAQILKEFAL